MLKTVDIPLANPCWWRT